MNLTFVLNLFLANESMIVLYENETSFFFNRLVQWNNNGPDQQNTSKWYYQNWYSGFILLRCKPSCVNFHYLILRLFISGGGDKLNCL